MKVLEKLPSMEVSKIMQLWRNAVEILADKKQEEKHDRARAVIEAINDEWLRRTSERGTSEEYFPWPSTEANPGGGTLATHGWPPEGMLDFVGYHVGSTKGIPSRLRRQILLEIFHGVLPPAFPQTYLAEWGKPGSVGRLQKLAETIAALTRNAKRRRDHSLGVAIDEWEADLEFLYEDFYVGKFHFGWPTTSDF